MCPPLGGIGQNHVLRTWFVYLQRLSTTFAKGPDNPPWILLAIRLDSLLQAARDREQSSSTTSSAMSFAKLANAIGGNVVSRLSTNDSLKKGVSEAQSDLSLADLLGSYQKTLNDTETEMLKGSGHTFKLASDTYAFNVDPSVKESTLLDAWDTLQKMHKGIITGAEDAQQQAVWYLLQGPLTFIFDYAQYSAACTLQQDWESQVLSSLQGVTDRDEANKLLYGTNGQVPTFMTGAVKPFVIRDATRYRPRQVLGQQLPLNGVFYAFVSRAQLETATYNQAQKDQQQSQKTMQAESDEVNKRIAEVNKQIDTLKATKAAVTITVEPTHANTDSTLLPQQTTLSLQCDSGAVTLNNYNFPASAVFNWSQATCGDVSLQISFPGLVLKKRWTGSHAFIDFLQLFAGGQYVFKASDFPSEKAALSAANIKSITLTYRAQGQAPLISAFSQLKTLSTESASLLSRRDVLQSALNTAPATSTSATSEGSSTSLVDQLIPHQIASCWQQTPSSTVPPLSSKTTAVTTPATKPPAVTPPAAVAPKAVTPPPPAAIAPAVAPPPPAVTAPAKSQPPAVTLPATVVPKTVEPPVTPAPAATSSNTSGGYQVQVGIFDEASAAPLVALLKAKGYSVLEHTIERGTHVAPYHLIRVGGYTDREQAVQAEQQIAYAFDVQPFIIPAQ